MIHKIVFIQPTDSTFMQIDYSILSEKYKVYRFVLSQTSKMRFFLNLCRLTAWSICNVSSYTTFVCWFADYHTLIPALLKKVLRKKLVIFVGGYDTYSYSELKMGVFLHPLRSLIARYSLKKADLIITNHESLIKSEHYYFYPNGHKDGLLNLIPDLKTPIKTIYNGFKPTYEVPVCNPKENIVLTVGTTSSWYDVINKGYDILIEAAKVLPDIQFIFVGIKAEWLPELENRFRYKALNNLIIIPHLSHPELFKLFARSKIYAQPSIIEGMPNALLEAMYFECIPIGSNVAGIPVLIGDNGIVIQKREASALIEAINEGLTLNKGKAARQHIIDCFSLEQRANSLIETIEKL